MLIKKIFLAYFCIILSIFLIACSREIEIGPHLENMTKDEFINITPDIKKIEVFDYKWNRIKTIKTNEQIAEVNSILKNIHEISGQIETESNAWFLLIYNDDKELICYISLWYRGYLGFGENIEKEYSLDMEYINSLVEIFES